MTFFQNRADPFIKEDSLKEIGALICKILPVVLYFFLPFLAVLIHDGLHITVLWAFLLQLLGHVRGVIYGIYRVTRD